MMMMNGAGFEPTQFNVLVRVQDVETKTAGGLILADETVEKKKFARQRGTLVAASPLAFTYATWPDEESKPKIGNSVVFAKYNATEFEGDDGETYWLMKDESIIGIVKDD